MTENSVKIAPVNVRERKNVDIRAGDTVRVHTRVVEKGKVRTQPFEGFVIARKHGSEPGATFTVRRTSGTYGVERIFPLYSPSIEKIDILRRSKVRQANVYHLRRKVAKQIRREMRRMTLLNDTLTDEAQNEDEETIEETAAESADSQEQKQPKEQSTSEAEGAADTYAETPEEAADETMDEAVEESAKNEGEEVSENEEQKSE